MEPEAMRFLNMFGNKFFGCLFTALLGQHSRTRCAGQRCCSDVYERIAAGRAYFGDFDPFGDFDLLFGAARLNLKIVELPIRYRARTYGETNISRFRHGVLLLRMTLFGFWKFRVEVMRVRRGCARARRGGGKASKGVRKPSTTSQARQAPPDGSGDELSPREAA